jgi:NADH:ubiquinone oxidoreductase subunit F (NADH-binding)/(2Fe-2S) ferredoxin
MKIQSFEELNELAELGRQMLKPGKVMFRAGMGTCGLVVGAADVLNAIGAKINALGLDAVVSKTGCMGFCYAEPLLMVSMPGKPSVLCRNMTTVAVSNLIEKVAGGKGLQEWALCYIPNGGDPDYVKGIPPITDKEFFGLQQRVAFRNCGFTNPDSIEEYVATGGFYSLFKALKEMTPDEVIEEVIKSGLRGRGGAGFPTGLKWKMARQAKAEEKFFICNADEGDPGVFKDRLILEADPFRLYEGMLVAGYAIGCSEGYIYLREEYPQAYAQLCRTEATLRSYGLLGRKIAGSDFDFLVHICKGGRSYIAGEESALMESIEGRVGEPRTRPPFPTKSGIFGKPTNINNVESLANIPEILRNGGEWYAGMGTNENKGTKAFCVVGHVRRPALAEVPFGTSLRRLIEDISGGVPEGHRLKAVHVGNPFGGLIPAERIDVALDDKNIEALGGALGSGAIVAMDDSTCIVERMKHLMAFLYEESCGKCTPCREGLGRLLEVLERILNGGGTPEDLILLDELAATLQDFSFCALGRMAPRPLLSSLRHFGKEFDEHIQKGSCLASR